MPKPLITINDDKGNPLNVDNNIDTRNGRIKGKSTSINPETGKRYPDGFTPPVDFINRPDLVDENGIPVEMGFISVNNNPDAIPLTPNKSLKNRKEDFDKQKDFSGKSFIHNYDYMSDGTPRSIPDNIKIKDVNLGSYVETGNDNEDPTIFGFDIIIDMENSPLFNGAIEEFIAAYPNISEIQSRLDTYQKFKDLFFKIFGSNNSENATKKHYLKKITGLDGLVESSQPELYKGLVDYRKDTIRLSIYEDVSMTLAELSMLYKTLTWSRINGKMLIPENLLRFNAEIVVTEIRKFNRFFKKTNSFSDVQKKNKQETGQYSTLENQTWLSSGLTDEPFTGMGNDIGSSITQMFGGSNSANIEDDINTQNKNELNKANDINIVMNEVVDLMSKYRYQLYECKFYFPKMSHGDSLDMWNSSISTASEGSEIIFDYKFTTLKLEKFTWNINKPTATTIDNSKIDPSYISSKETNNSSVSKDGTISHDEKLYDVTYMKSWNIDESSSNKDISNILNGKPDGPLDILDKESSKNRSSIVNDLLNKLKLATFNEINRQILSRARLINKSIDSIRNKIGMGRIDEPTNVYEGNSLYMNDLKNAVRNFVGDSVKDFFKK